MSVRCSLMMALVMGFSVSVSSSFSIPIFWGEPPKTVDSLDLSAYSGRWYQAYSSLLPNRTFEKDGFCVTADYTVLNNLTLGVKNSQTLKSPFGKLVFVNGTATVEDPKEPGKLTVKFDKMGWISFIPKSYRSNYWVIGLGPIDANGKYAWAGKKSQFNIIIE